MFLTQSLNKDSSCQKVVNEVSLVTQSCSIATGAYCKARKRLDKSMIENMRKNLALSNENKIK